MKSLRIVLGIAVVVLAGCAVAFLVADGPRAAWSPALYAVLGGITLYVAAKHPATPRPWSKQQVIVSALVGGTASVAVVAALAWVVVVVPDWPTRLLALVGIAFVPAFVFWVARIARQQHQAARDSAPGGTST